MKKTKFLSIFLILAMMLTFVGCSSSKDDSSADNSQTSQATDNSQA
jgi:PBP1b-binding outer membrane lipoprotein LpoB